MREYPPGPWGEATPGWLAELLYGEGVGWDDPESYVSDLVEEEYETTEIVVSSWFSSSIEEWPIDPTRYRGTRLDWFTLEEYRALNPRVGG